jgi:HlyD family secretion protein
MRSTLRWIVPAGITIVAIGVAGLVFWPETPAATKPAAQHVPRVASGSVTAKGTVQPVATRVLSFAISGTVSEVKVKAGDAVTAGQLLTRLDPTDAEAAVTDAANALSDAETALDEAEAAAAATCAPVAAGPSASPTCTNARQGGGGDAIFSAQQQVNNARASLSRVKRELAGTRITAPVAGKVLSVSIKVGDTARSSVITLGVVSQMVVKASFSESDVVALSLGQTASITLPGGGDTAYPGKVTNRLVTYDVLITFDEVPAGLLVGQSANVTVPA